MFPHNSNRLINNLLIALLIGLCLSCSRPRTPSTPLHTAAIAGDTAKIESLLKSGTDVNTLDGDGNTALVYAVGTEHWPAADYLLAKGGKLDYIDKRGSNPMSRFASNGNAQQKCGSIKTGAP